MNGKRLRVCRQCQGFLSIQKPGGNDANAGSSAAPFKTIGKGLSVATAGQVVAVSPGTYSSASGEVFPLALRRTSF